MLVGCGRYCGVITRCTRNYQRQKRVRFLFRRRSVKGVEDACVGTIRERHQNVNIMHSKSSPKKSVHITIYICIYSVCIKLRQRTFQKGTNIGLGYPLYWFGCWRVEGVKDAMHGEGYIVYILCLAAFPTRHFQKLVTLLLRVLSVFRRATCQNFDEGVDSSSPPSACNW